MIVFAVLLSVASIALLCSGLPSRACRKCGKRSTRGGFFWGGCACCTINCGSFCSANRPTEYQLDVSGMANDECSNCAAHDGTYFLPLFGSGLTACCTYPFTETTDICSGAANSCGFGGPSIDGWTIQLCAPGAPGNFTSNYRVRVIFDARAQQSIWEYTTPTQPDCCDTSGWSLAWVSDLGACIECDGSAASMTITPTAGC